jgi:hypothetical protein
VVFFAACTAKETVIEPTDFAFDGTCVNCHVGLSAGHVHTNYKLRCIDCHGGNDQVDVPDDVLQNKSLVAGAGGFRDPALLKQAHITPDPNIARYFYANGVDDDGDGVVDEPPLYDQFPNPTQLLDPGEIFEPGLHGEGPGEFMDAELNRDLNYTRFYNPGDLRVASISCGRGSRGAFDGGGNGSCHQQTIDIVRRGMMANQAAVTNGAYYGNESGRADVANKIAALDDPRFGAFGYALDYADPSSVDACILPPANPIDPRSQPTFDKQCLQDRAAQVDGQFPAGQGGNAIVAGQPGNIGVNGENPSTFEIAQGVNTPVPGVEGGTTIVHEGAGDTRYPWGGNATISDAHAKLDPLLNGELLPGLIPDPVDNILRTFRAYYPLNYPASTTNFNFTFGTSILPEVARFRTGTPYGRGHSSGCSSCHTPYSYDGARQPTAVRADDGSIAQVVDPTTKHREFNAAKDRGPILGLDRLIGRPVRADEVLAAGGVAQGAVDVNGDGILDGEQQRAYSQNHTTTTKIDTDTCGLCHGFVTRINYAYQGMAEEEQRDSLARRKPIEFETPNGTKVRILDSWVREDNDLNFDGIKDAVPTVVIPAGVEVVNKAIQRDKDLAAQGFLAGFGGCVPAVFSEDCNNNGELDTALTLDKLDIDGDVVASVTINEDQNGNGQLDLIDRLPRERAIDGRQVRYVYGGRNGSTRQMDVHFQRGMHCIDCHFLQDVHGDGNVYSTNWDAIEIECEDCHGTSTKTMSAQGFLTSGPNGGNDLRRAVNEDLEPFFESRDGRIIQRSRVTRGLTWVVPQTAESANPYAREAHAPVDRPDAHVAEQAQGSTFAGEQGSSEIVSAKVDCATCHNGWITNCLGCHTDINVGDLQRDKVAPDGSITKSAGENEIWMSNTHNPGHINFQLLGLLRAPFVLGVASNSEQGRLVTVRSSMQVFASATDTTGDTLRENLTFTTFQMFDGNSGRNNVATSGVVMNQTMAHTVRPQEARGCEMCHPLVDNGGRVRNEHLLAQTYGLGTGSLPFTGDWIMAAGTNGLELFEYKQERELANNNNVGASQRFPGMIVNPNTRFPANVEPIFNGGGGVAPGAIGTDVLLIRNFNATPSLGGFEAPTLRDFAVMSVDNLNGTGRVVITDISARGHRDPAIASRPGTDNTNKVATVIVPEAPLSLAHIASDVSDPFVYVAHGNTGISVIRIADAVPLSGLITAVRENTTGLPGGDTATDVALAGDFLYVGTAQGRIHAFNINNPTQPVPLGNVQVGSPVRDMVVAGFVLYAATNNGTAIVGLDDPANPAPPLGANQIPVVGLPANGVVVSEGHVFVANGAQGIHEIDARIPAQPVDLGPINVDINGNLVAMTAVDVIVSQLPGQKWVIGLDLNGDILGFKLDGTQTKQERCYPDSSLCLLELEMYDPTRTGRDPSFDPNNNLFDLAVDPSANPFFRQVRQLNASGRRLARPAFFEAIGTLSGRRYRDSFMPGSGVMSLGVMQAMRSVEICELAGVASTNPSGLDELGYVAGGACVPFAGANAKRTRPVCSPKTYGPGIRGILCEEPKDTKTADPTRKSPFLPATAAIFGVTASP